MFNLKDSKTIGYHLFFLPTGELFDRIKIIINELAEKYDGAKFEPHVTLLARIPEAEEEELISKTKQLAGIMEPFEIEPKEICTEDIYFRALYCKAEHSEKLEEYHKKSLEIFGVEDSNQYIPHLSLYYGNIPQSVKDEMINSLQLPQGTKFLADKVYLYKTDGETRNWKPICAFSLGK